LALIAVLPALPAGKHAPTAENKDEDAHPSTTTTAKNKRTESLSVPDP